jgi:hypothetical protein
MRGSDERAGALFSYVDLEARVPAAHLSELSSTFARLDAPLGRPSIPPEQLLRALLLQLHGPSLDGEPFRSAPS